MKEKVEGIYKKMVMADLEIIKIEKKLPYIETQKGREFETKRLKERLGKLELEEKELFQEFLKQDPTDDELCEVVKWIVDIELREAAAKILLEHNPSNSQLCCIVEKTLGPLHIKAAQMLLKQNPNNDQLCAIIRIGGDPREEAVEMLLKKNPSDDHLRCCLNYRPSNSLLEKVGEMLLERIIERPLDDGWREADLHLIVEKCSRDIPSLAKKAVQLYLGKERTPFQLVMLENAIKNPELLKEVRDLRAKTS